MISIPTTQLHQKTVALIRYWPTASFNAAQRFGRFRV
jgi:hypothetical protein